MNSPDLFAPWLVPLGWLALEAVVVGLAALAAQPLLRTAATRRSLWRAALLALLAVLAAELTGTSSRLPTQLRLAWQTTFPAPVPPPAPTSAPEQLPFTPPPVFPLAPTGGEGRGEGAVPAPDALASTTEPLASSPPSSLHPSVRPSPPSPWPAFLWLTGLAALLARAAWTHAGFAWLRFRHFIPAAETLRQRVQSLAARLGLRRRVRVLASERLHAPAAFGWMRPGVAVPGDFTARFAPVQQDVMLAHELAHLAARDPLWQLLADLAVAALWWHPLAWVARHQHRLAAELAADDASQALPDGPVVLAECLLALGQEAAAAPRAPLGMAGFRSQLGRRVERLVALPRHDWSAPGPLRLALQTTLALLALAALALLLGCATNRAATEAPSSLVAKWWQAKKTPAPVGDDVRSLQSNAEGGTRGTESSQRLVTSSSTNGIDISVGRQLFVDDFLIESNTLKRTWHHPALFSTAPLLAVRNQLPPVSQFFDSVWFEPTNQHFKLGLAHGVRFFRDYHSPSGTNWYALNSQSHTGPLVEQPHQQVTTDYESLRVGLSREADGIRFAFSRAGAELSPQAGQPVIPLPLPADGSRWTDMHPLRNGFLVVGRNLYCYFGGQVTNHGPPVTVPGFPPQQAAVGLATLRRDGFASLDAGPEGGVMTTKPVVFRGKLLCVNLKTNAPDGELRVEILYPDGRPVELTPNETSGKRIALSLANSRPLADDQTLLTASWVGGLNFINSLAGRPVRFRFHLKNASLYSFWVADSISGRSMGAIAGGGPNFKAATDTVGIGSYAPLRLKEGALGAGDFLRAEISYRQGTNNQTLRMIGRIANAGYFPVPGLRRAVVVAGKTIEEAQASIREGFLGSGFEAVEVKLTKTDPPPPALRPVPAKSPKAEAAPSPVGDDVRSLTPTRNAESGTRNVESSQSLVTSAATVAAGDVLRLIVAEDDSYSADYPVRRDGNIVIKGVGRVPVGGRRLVEAQVAVKAMLEATQLSKATVTLALVGEPGRTNTVSIVTDDQRVIYLAGEFLTPGPLKLPEGVPLSFANVLLRSGGITTNGSLAGMKRLRIKDGQGEIEEVKVAAILAGTRPATNDVLLPGDILMVPALAPVVTRAVAPNQPAPVGDDVRSLTSTRNADDRTRNEEASQSLVTSSPTNAIDISVGRQLFVDDFLIASNSLQRTWHKPAFFADTPSVKLPAALTPPGPLPVCDRIWYDTTNQLFKMRFATTNGIVAVFQSPSGTNWVRGETNATDRALRFPLAGLMVGSATYYESVSLNLFNSAHYTNVPPGVSFTGSVAPGLWSHFGRRGSPLRLLGDGLFISPPTIPVGAKWENMYPALDAFLVVGRNLYFYFGGQVTMAGEQQPHPAVGLATLRRDGFASLDAGPEGGVLTTKPVTFTGRFMFVNFKTNAPDGELRIEILHPDGRPIEVTKNDTKERSLPFSLANAVRLAADQTLMGVNWQNGMQDLSMLANRPVRFRFHLKNASLYSFWVGPGQLGRSMGRVAGGGPHFTNDVDTIGNRSYRPFPVVSTNAPAPKPGGASAPPATVGDDVRSLTPTQTRIIPGSEAPTTVLAAGDSVRIQISYLQNGTNQSLAYRGEIAPAGYVPIPRVSKAVFVAGKTIEEATRMIREQLVRDGLESPLVTLDKAVPLPVAPPGTVFRRPTDTYRIHAGDELIVSVWGRDDLRTKGKVQSDGRMTLPLVKAVPVAGSTLSHARAAIKAAYQPAHLAEAHVAVQLIRSVQPPTNGMAALSYPTLPDLVVLHSLTLERLAKVRLPEVSFNAVSLPAVLQQLNADTLRLDPGQDGIKFEVQKGLFTATAFDPTPSSDPVKYTNASGAVVSVKMNGSPSRSRVRLNFDMDTVSVSLPSALRGVPVLDALEAIVTGADYPIRYTIETNRVIFWQRHTDEPSPAPKPPAPKPGASAPAPSPFAERGEKVAEGRLRGAATNADAANPSPQPSPLTAKREREPESIAPVGDDMRSLHSNSEHGAGNADTSQRRVTSSPTPVRLAAASPKGVTLPVPNPYYKTNSQVPILTHSSKGAQRINRKLEEIVLPEVHFDAVPLVGVVQRLIEDAKKFDPEKQGLNFLINDVAPAAPLLDAAGNPVPVARPVALSEGLVRVGQPLKNLTLRQALDVICKTAELPTQFSVEEYAIAFIPRGPVAYYSRIFRVNPDTFIQGLQGVVGNPVLGITPGGGNAPGAAGQNQPATTTTTTGPVRATVPATVPATQRTPAEANALVRQFFQSAGVTALGATNGSTRVTFNPENGLLFVRGTTNDLRLIEQAIQKVQPPTTPPTNAAPNRPPTPNSYYRTNTVPVHSSKGALRINAKLDEIILPEIRFDSVTLPEVLKWLDVNVKKLDPEKKGLNFLINNVVSDYVSLNDAKAGKPAAPVLDAKGNPIASPAAKPPRPDLENALIKVTGPVKDLTLRQALDVICNAATVKMPDGRIAGLKFTVEEYAIVFSPKLPEQAAMFSRVFKVDPETFLKGLRTVAFDENQLKPGTRAALDQALREKAWTNAPAGIKQLTTGGPSLTNGVFSAVNTNLTAELNHLVRLYFTDAGVANLAATDAGPDATQVFFNDRNGLLLVRASLQDLDIIQQAVELLNAKPQRVKFDVTAFETGPTTERPGVSMRVVTAEEARTITKRFMPTASRQSDLAVIVPMFESARVPLFGQGNTNGPSLQVLPILEREQQLQITVLTDHVSLPRRFSGVNMNAREIYDYVHVPGQTPPRPAMREDVKQPVSIVSVPFGHVVVVSASTAATGAPSGSAPNAGFTILLTPTLVDPAGNRVHKDAGKPTGPAIFSLPVPIPQPQR